MDRLASVREIWLFLRARGNWHLVLVITASAIIGLLLATPGEAVVSPMIYTLF